ncbi:MAG TPA: GntR family transcriptional regulator [Opitutaceae bacterium]|nr:GntR family transcriptional regulator [Opitutaceae bacterium]
MLPFDVKFKPGAPAYEQVVYAVKKAVITGALKPGDPFPSVRALSQELRINPNTVQKAVATLCEESLLRVRPGIGTVVAELGPASRADKAALLRDEVERLVVEARKLHLDSADIIEAVREHWARLASDQPAYDERYRVK